MEKVEQTVTPMLVSRFVLPPPPKPVPSGLKVPNPPPFSLKVSGKAGDLSSVTNAEFITRVFTQIPEGASAAVCSKPGDPTEGGWTAVQAIAVDLQKATANNFVSCSSFLPSKDTTFSVKKEQFAAYHTIMLDDLGTKVPLEKLG